MKRIYFALFIYVVLLLNSSMSWQKRRIKGIPYGVGTKYRSRPSYSVRRTGISTSRMGVLFPTLGSLGTIYIASSMRPHFRPRTYRDLYDYTVCKGRRSLVENGSTVTYEYFLCPDDINQPFERYCCVGDNDLGVCCSYDEKSNNFLRTSGSVLGSVVGVIIFSILVGVLFYCCCYRRGTRKSPANTAAIVTSTAGVPGVSPYGQEHVGTDQPQANVPPYPGSYPHPYPNPALSKENRLPYPATDPFPTASYPQAPSLAMTGGNVAPQPPAISSGWGAPGAATTSPGTVGAGSVPNSGYEAPPPPYSVAVATAPYPPT